MAYRQRSFEFQRSESIDLPLFCDVIFFEGKSVIIEWHKLKTTVEEEPSNSSGLLHLRQPQTEITRTRRPTPNTPTTKHPKPSPQTPKN